jgi:hypothetical protein
MMTPHELEQYAADYLSRLADDECAFHALIEADHAILPILVRAFRRQADAKLRATILQVIWQHRQLSSIPILEEALRDSSALVWKEALDGLVTINARACLSAIERARKRQFSAESEAIEFREFLYEAIQQLRHGCVGEDDLDVETSN